MKHAAILFAATALACGPAALAKAPPAAAGATAGSRVTRELAQGWKFHLGDLANAQRPDLQDADWQPVTVPHTWNKVGAYAADAGSAAGAGLDKTQGIGWYRLAFTPPRLRPGQRLWLEFDAASRTAEVWLNGVRLGRHDGGFSRFRFDATAALHNGAANLLAVKTDNSAPVLGSATADILPLQGDFFVHGGLYRPVRLVVTDALHVDMLDAGGPGIYAATLAASPETARVAVTVKLRNLSARAQRAKVEVSLVDRDGRVAARAVIPATMRAGASAEVSRQLAVSAPHLWQGVADPYLYRLVANIRSASGTVTDHAEQQIGIRTIRLDPQQGLFLNGKHLALHGVGLHQDRQPEGWAQAEANITDTLATIRDMGANTIRLTHYQHGQPVHDLADRAGLLVWDEIPLVTAWTVDPARGTASDGLRANARQQLEELIRQNGNHPSVAVWGIANEVDFGPNRPDFLGRPPEQIADPRPLLVELNALAKRLDPARPTALATCCEDTGMPKTPVVADITDTAGANRYFGWYYARPEMLGPHLDALHAKRPNQPLAVTEYGAGGALSVHTDDPRGGPLDAGGHDQPEETQTMIHELSWPQLQARPYLWATWLWNSFDFSSTARREGDSVDINTKGLVSYDGKTRKDAFWFYRANWSAQPTVHINGRRYVDRAFGVTDVRVASNAPRTELRLNGRSLGTKSDCPAHVCVWQAVRLDTGENTLTAQGSFPTGPVQDRLRWLVRPEAAGQFRIDSGALVAAGSTAGRYGSDAFFDGGQARTTDQHPRGRPPVPAAIAVTPDRDLVATYREGRFGYRLPLANGRYQVRLDFVEPGLAAGERVFDVLANGTVRLGAIDIAAAAGKPLVAVSREFEVAVTDGMLDLRFVPAKGDAIVSAVAVRPVPNI